MPEGPWRTPKWLTQCQGLHRCSQVLVQVPVLLSGLMMVALNGPVAPWLLNQAPFITSPAELEVLLSVHPCSLSSSLLHEDPGWAPAATMG